jgi:hypothetical protein
MEGELHFRCCKDVGLAREIAAAHLQRHSALWGKSFSKDSDPGAAVISPRSVYGIDYALIRPLRSNSNCLSGELVCELVAMHLVIPARRTFCPVAVRLSAEKERILAMRP